MLHRRALLSLAPLSLMVLLPGCGFQPLYGEHGGTQSPVNAALAAVNVDNIPERSGQVLRLALQQRFAQGGLAEAPRYDLSVVFGLSGNGVAIQPSSASYRVRLIGSAIWTLRAEDAAQATMATGSARVVDGYNNIDGQAFAGDMESEAVERRMALNIADQITMQVAAYFNRHFAAAPQPS